MPGRTLGRQPPVKLAGVAFGGLIRGSRSRRAAGARAACERLRACFRPKSGIGSPGSFRGGMATGTGPGLRGHHCPCQCGGLPRAPSRSGSAPTEVATSQNPATHRVRSPHLLRDHVHRTHTPPLGPRPRGRGLLHPLSGPGPGTRTSLGSGFARGLRSLVCREGQEDGAGVPGTTPVWGDLSLSPQAWMSRHPRPQSRSPPAGLTASATDGGLTRRQQPPAWRRI